jgi:CBS domain-containing protein
MVRDGLSLDASWTVDDTMRHIIAANGAPQAYPVLDPDGRLIGMVETPAILAAAGAGLGSRRVGELARPATVHAHPDHSLDTALVKLGRLGASALPVVSRKDTRKLLGVVTMQAIAAAMAREADGDSVGLVSGGHSPPPSTASMS